MRTMKLPQLIFLSEHTVALLHVYKRHSCLEEVFLECDCKNHETYNQKRAEKSAKNLIDQMEDQWTRRFLRALRKEIDLRLKEK